ncbi:hypothetical conserved protein [Clostridium sp. CAG:492]|nr:hypothetical conserved protein [Clostridium sp. CAG:492]
MKKAIIIIVSVLVVAIATCTCLYFFTDVFNFIKPASANFSSQAKKLLGTDKDNKYSDYEAMLKKLKISDKSYTSNADISMNVSVPNSIVDSSTQKLINSSKIKYNGSYDANSKAMSNNVGLYKDNKEFLTLQLVQKDQTVSVGCKDLYDKTLNFDLSKYDEFCQKNNITADEETKASIDALKSMKDSNYTDFLYDLLYLSEDDFNSLNKTYGNLLSDLISKDNYSTKKNEKITVGGDDVKTTAYSLTLSGEDAYNFINKLVDLVKKDDTTKKLIIDKYNILKKYNTSLISAYDEVEDKSANQNTELPDLTVDNINSFLDDLVKDLEKSKDDFTNSDKCLQFTIYSDKKSEPVKFEISVLDDKKDKEGTTIFTEELSDGKTKYTIDIKNINKLSSNQTNEDDDDDDTYSNVLKNSSSYTNALNTTKSTTSSNKSKTSSSLSTSLDELADSISELIIEDSYKKTDDSRKGTITISAKTSNSKQEVSKQEMLKIDYENINSKSEYKTSFSISSPLQSYASLDYTYDITGLDKDTQDIKLELSGKYASLYSAKISATGSITYGKSDIPELTADTSVDVFSLPQADLQKIASDIVTKASDTLPAKLSLYRVTVTKEDILSILPANTATQDVATPDAETPVVTQPAA